MAHFKLTGAKHQEREGDKLVVYKKGDVIKSSEDLIAKFTGKFEKATGDDMRAFKKQKIKEEEEAARVLQEEEELEAKLEKQSAYEGDEETDEDEDDVEESRLGVDCTDEFEAGDFKVFKQGRLYNISKSASPDKAIRNGKELTKTQVRAYLKEHAPEEESEDVESVEETDEDES